ncbi:MAG TPA: TraB/GumN family protein [Saprospiraceae bacterium]|nr:TraB/GumN family protein [Saprospiraceae bacterium]HMQ84890.1 TraB/GumN family protein [Saprospiraceae bacterium]
MKYLFLGLISLFLTIHSYSQEESTRLENALLWEISGNNLKAASYLYGTIHLIGEADFFLTEATKASFEKAQQVAFEIDMEEMTDFTQLMPLMMQAFMAGDTTLADLLSQEDYALVQEHFEEMGMPLMFLERIKPMFLSAMADTDLADLQGESGAVSYEMEMMEMAQKRKVPIEGLETAAFQMSLFDSIPYKIQAQMLVDAVKADDSGDDQFQAMVELYKKQDIEGMQTMVQEDEAGIGKYEELLLVKRNKNWIPVMAKMMVQKPTFFAVGAGHLGGKYGVITLLREAGYTLKPLY